MLLLQQPKKPSIEVLRALSKSVEVFMSLGIENKILYEELLQEAFLDTIKSYAKEKLNQAVDTINDWKDAAVVFGKIISSGELLNDFLKPLQRRFEKSLESLYDFLRKVKLDSFISVVEKAKDKVTSLGGWQKLLALTALGSISYYIVNKLKGASLDKIKGFITNNLSVDFLKDVLSNLTSWTSFVGVLQPILDGVGSIYGFLKELLSKFSTALTSNNQWATKLVKEEVERMQKLAGII